MGTENIYCSKILFQTGEIFQSGGRYEEKAVYGSTGTVAGMG
jgi:hypothetical protein